MRRAITSALLLALAACSSSQQPPPQDASKKVEAGAKQFQQGAQQLAEGARSSSEQMARGLQQMAQGFQQMAQGSAKAIDFEELKAMLPELDGWTRSDTKGEQLTMPVAYSRAETRYRNDASRIELEITDTAFSQLLLAPLSMFFSAGYSERSDDGFKRATKIGGQPGMEEWNARSHRGEVTAVCGSRFVVKATGHDIDSLDVVRKVVESVDLAKLAAIK